MLNKLIGIINCDVRHQQKIENITKQIIKLENKYSSYTDGQLANKTKDFISTLEKGNKLDDILIDAYAVVREADRRVLKQFPYYVQVKGAVALFYGDIAEMKTGEGKTLTSTMPLYLHALTKKGVHLITTNEYLAKRDAENIGQVFKFLGLTVGLNHHELSSYEKKQQYSCEITYTTNSELGFDFLRDSLETSIERRVLRGLEYALIDEVDSILIDEARTPLIISGMPDTDSNLYHDIDSIVKKLSLDDYIIDIKEKTIYLSDNGHDKIQKALKIDNIYDHEHSNIVHIVNQSLRANYIMKKDIDYVVKDDKIQIVDEFTGRIMESRQYSNGLHQAIEAKENVYINQENKTLASITYQNLFREYNKLSGMSGTAKTEEIEFLKIYNMRVIEIETNKKVARKDNFDFIYPTRKEKFSHIVTDIKKIHQTGQPILIGTAYIDDSEYLSYLLKKEKLNHVLLNAKNDENEANIISKAGQINAITIATNMASRGTDIKLGEGVNDLGGLYVIGAQRHEAKRIDNQLIGRSGRQGDNGETRFYVSLEDDLIKRFATDSDIKKLKSLNHGPQATKIVDIIQKSVDAQNYNSRKNVLEFDDILNLQRKTISNIKEEILESKDVLSMINDQVQYYVDNYFKSENIDCLDESIWQEKLDHLFKETDFRVDYNQIFDKNSKAMIVKLKRLLMNYYYEKTKDLRVEINDYEKQFLVSQINQSWRNHVDEMLELKKAVNLRSYANIKPIQAYTEEALLMYNDMMNKLSKETLNFCLKLQVRN